MKTMRGEYERIMELSRHVGFEQSCEEVCHPGFGCCYMLLTGPEHWRCAVAYAREQARLTGRRHKVIYGGNGEWYAVPYQAGLPRAQAQEGCTSCGHTGPWMAQCSNPYHKRYAERVVRDA